MHMGEEGVLSNAPIRGLRAARLTGKGRPHFLMGSQNIGKASGPVFPGLRCQ